MFGIGTGKDLHQAIQSLRQASERGNIYVSDQEEKRVLKPQFIGLGYGSASLRVLREKTIH